jgi:hypothetical protein
MLAAGIIPVARVTGLPTFPSGTIVGTTDTQILTNKEIDPRVQDNNAPSSPQTPNSDSYDVIIYRGITAALTINAPTATSPVSGRRLLMRFKDNGTARALTWNAIFVTQDATNLPIPTTTAASKTGYVLWVYNQTDNTWDLLAKINL